MRVTVALLSLLLVGCGSPAKKVGLTGEKCALGPDCASGVCTQSVCAPWTFTKINSEIFTGSCEFSSCHSKDGAKSAGKLDMKSATPGAYASLVGAAADNPMAKGEGKLRVTAGDAANSFLYIKLSIPPTSEAGQLTCVAQNPITGYGGCMPQSNPPLDPSQLDGIKGWIAAGAANN